MILTIVIDWIVLRDVFFLVLILTSSKVANFHNEAHTFLYKNIRHWFFNITNRNIVKVITFIFWFLFYLWLKDNHYVIRVILSVIQDQFREHILLNYSWYIYSLGSICLHPLVRRTLHNHINYLRLSV